MPARLITVSDGVELVLDKPIMLVGRQKDCDLIFESRKISRIHCCIAELDNRLIVRDLASTNGILINGVKLEEGYLNSGDELAIGNLRFRIQLDGATRKPKAASDGKAKPAPETAIAPSSADSWDNQPIPLSD